MQNWNVYVLGCFIMQLPYYLNHVQAQHKANNDPAVRTAINNIQANPIYRRPQTPTPWVTKEIEGT